MPPETYFPHSTCTNYLIIGCIIPGIQLNNNFGGIETSQSGNSSGSQRRRGVCIKPAGKKKQQYKKCLETCVIERLERKRKKNDTPPRDYDGEATHGTHTHPFSEPTTTETKRGRHAFQQKDNPLRPGAAVGWR